MRIVKNETEINSLDDWFLHAPPRGGRSQWRDGRSAKELARAWCGGGAVRVPHEVAQLIASIPGLSNLELEWAEPEARIRFDDAAGEPRNADLVAIGSAGPVRVALNVEAKADEPFGPPVVDELSAAVHRAAFDESRGKLNRILALADALLPRRHGGGPRLGELRYQLLTATAGALAFAAQQGCEVAILSIHEFHRAGLNERRLADSARDLDSFVSRVSTGAMRAIVPGQVVGPLNLRQNPWGTHILYIGKVRRYLDEVPGQNNGMLALLDEG